MGDRFNIGDQVIVTLDKGMTCESVEPAIVKSWPSMFGSIQIECERDGFTLWVQPEYLEPASGSDAGAARAGGQ